MKILTKILACGALALGIFAVPAVAADTTRSFADPGVVRCQVCGAQYRVSHTPIGSRTHSEFILCDGFAFRPSNVDGYSHQAYADGSAVTIVNFNHADDSRLRAKAIRFSDSETQTETCQ